MTITERIQQLSPQIKRALQPEFIFILKQDTIQHFPIRQWSNKQIKQEILSRYQQVQTTTVDHHLICYGTNDEPVLIIPKVATFAELT
ncbi:MULTISPECIES: hypothetical protein [Enterococcus]|uniref:Uncharacterized protein n=1 Tax=Enterococcus sulfureus ATCC 49903 TaxID=1140003 RepID=S0L3Q3_9ENTE|nr:hypothetical protein [Enterococcus sulfureus]EOT47975.1 hypothetical protein OMY_00782 [Enterococcus sulfureus ATCC 49903]EOT84169.1 hypothetical protein I573_01896 [Enterococcus sulfureus ATCC 49903]